MCIFLNPQVVIFVDIYIEICYCEPNWWQVIVAGIKSLSETLFATTSDAIWRRKPKQWSIGLTVLQANATH